MPVAGFYLSIIVGADKRRDSSGRWTKLATFLAGRTGWSFEGGNVLQVLSAGGVCLRWGSSWDDHGMSGMGRRGI